jgi:murein L,D-transpeptidase YcbB/YkuD
MRRLSIEREGSIVSSRAPDDWAELDTDSRAAGASDRRRRTGGALATPQLTALVAALLAIAASAVVLILVFGGDDGPGVTTGAPTAAVATTDPTPTSPAASPLRVTLPGQGRIGMGVKGDSVTRLQRALVAIGLDPGPRDGVFGRRTQAAVIAFQRQHGLVADGVVGRKTAAALNAALADRSR